MPLNSYINDPSIPDDKKIAGLMSLGHSRLAAQLMLRLKNQSIPEGMYERLLRDPARREIGGVFEKGPLGAITGPSKGPSIAKSVTNFVVPEDLEGALSTAGSFVPGGGFARGAGAEIGGIVGGRAQGRGYLESGLRAAPAAISAAILPWVVRKLIAGAIEHGMSQRATAAIANGAQKLFSAHFPERVPINPNELGDFFAKEGPAVANTGKRLGDFRDILRTQPAFARVGVSVPVKTIDPVTHQPRTFQWGMSLSDALDYQSAMYGRGYTIKGGPRGGIVAEPDRAIASATRDAIDRALRKVNPRFADRYQDLSRDYGVAQVMGDVVTPNTVKGGTLDHPAIYDNAFNPNNSVHMKNLVGPDKTRQFLADVAPKRQVIQAQPDSHIGLRPHPVPVHVSVKTPNPAKAPVQFTPAYAQQRVMSPLAAGAASSQVENPSGYIDPALKGVFGEQ